MNDPFVNLPEALRRFLFSEGTMATVVGGKSALDLSFLRVGGRDEAVRFLARYGYDLDNLSHRNGLERVRSEATGFIRGILLQGLDLSLPVECDRMPIIDLLMTAARQPGTGTRAEELQQAWACALLRIMHTVAHSENYFQEHFYPQIREEVLERFVQQVHTEADGSQVLKGRTCDVPLVRFEVKETKPLRSAVLKLLQKEENVAYDLFDHIGVRMIVRRPVEALCAVRALHEQHTIMYPNIKPTRSRNTLIDIGAFDRLLAEGIEAWRRGEVEEDALIEQLWAANFRPSNAAQLAWNPHSSDKYNAIQFTCRQMIRFPNPLYHRMRRAREVAERHLQGDGRRQMLSALDMTEIDKEIQFFFPYEVQIMDLASFEEAAKGRAAYAEYKQRQVVTARRRVLGRVLELTQVSADDPVVPRDRQRTGPVQIRKLMGSAARGRLSDDLRGRG